MARALGLALIGVSCAACTAPDGGAPDSAVSDGGSELDSGGMDMDAPMPLDAGEEDAGPPDTGPPGMLGATGGIGTHGGAVSVSGDLAVVDQGFELSGLTCNGALCAYGGFR